MSCCVLASKATARKEAVDRAVGALAVNFRDELAMPLDQHAVDVGLIVAGSRAAQSVADSNPASCGAATDQPSPSFAGTA
jgi:hypothetical protein